MNRLFLQGILLLQGSFFSLLFSSSPSLRGIDAFLLLLVLGVGGVGIDVFGRHV